MKMVKARYLVLGVIAAGVLAGCATSPGVVTLPAGNYTYPTDTYYLHVPTTYIPAGTWYYPADTYYSDGYYQAPLCNTCGMHNSGY